MQLVNPGTTHNPEAPPPVTPADVELVCAAVAADLVAKYAFPPEVAGQLRECLCAAVSKGGAFTDAALAFYAEKGAYCLSLHMETCAGPAAACAETVADLRADVEAAFERHTQRWRSKGFRQRGGIARVSRRRGKSAKQPRKDAGASCGSKRKYWKEDPGLAARLEWLRNNCGGGKAAKPGEAAGGDLARARRSAGLWDAANPVDQQGAGPGPNGHISDGTVNRDSAGALQGSMARAAEKSDAMTTARASDWGTASKLGYSPCQTPGAGMSCFDPASGLERRWTVTGRHFTKAEQGKFLETQCKPHCGAYSIANGAPADAKTGVRRIAPRNPAVKSSWDCQRGPTPSPMPGLVLRPLPGIQGGPGAVGGMPACRPDTVVGVDGGMFGSGWWQVIRNGVRMLVPNPELCGGPIPKF